VPLVQPAVNPFGGLTLVTVRTAVPVLAIVSVAVFVAPTMTSPNAMLPLNAIADAAGAPGFAGVLGVLGVPGAVGDPPPHAASTIGATTHNSPLIFIVIILILIILILTNLSILILGAANRPPSGRAGSSGGRLCSLDSEHQCTECAARVNRLNRWSGRRPSRERFTRRSTAAGPRRAARIV
jgi:hypothetical protein